MFVAGFVAVKRTESTRAFLYIQLSQQISIYSGTDAHATPCRCSLKIYICLHEPYVPLMGKIEPGRNEERDRDRSSEGEAIV